ncbi:MAG TPA: hypothetical protein VHC86_05870 [Opitutaceae bacterium]|nr:hypothetical protein [Opitutaceae bacterium]
MLRPVLHGALVLAVAALGAARTDAAWQEAAFPGFEVYSDHPDETIEALMANLRLVQRDFERLWPMPQVRISPPARIVFCDRLDDFLSFNPPNPAGAGFIWQFTAERSWMLVNMRLPRPPATAPLLVDHRLREFYANCVLRQMGERVPPWLDWGLGKFVHGMVCTPGSLALPALTTDPTLAIRGRGSAADLKAALQARRFLSLEELFSVQRMPQFKKIEVHMQEGRMPFMWAYEPSDTFVDEAYEFVHFCLIDGGSKYRDAFIRFAQAAANGPLDEAGFQRFFGKNYADMLLELWADTGPAEPRGLRIVGAYSLTRLPFRPLPDSWFPAFHADWMAAKSLGSPVPVIDSIWYW